jgi:RNA polymerase-binding protein DksA
VQEFHKRMQQVLLEEKAKVSHNLATEQADFHEMIEHQEVGDIGDEVSQTQDKQILETIGSQTALTLQKIEAALTRLEGGVYGICVGCGRAISEERLEAIPEAPFCIDCQNHLHK